MLRQVTGTNGETPTSVGVLFCWGAMMSDRTRLILTLLNLWIAALGTALIPGLLSKI